MEELERPKDFQFDVYINYCPYDEYGYEWAKSLAKELSEASIKVLLPGFRSSGPNYQFDIDLLKNELNKCRNVVSIWTPTYFTDHNQSAASQLFFEFNDDPYRRHIPLLLVGPVHETVVGIQYHDFRNQGNYYELLTDLIHALGHATEKPFAPPFNDSFDAESKEKPTTNVKATSGMKHKIDVDVSNPKNKITEKVRSDFRREASHEEECLDAPIYADAIKWILKYSSDGEFCFGLFGHWGRGKTFLINYLEKSLEKEQYEIVRFNAWKYRNTPETWINLYETFADRACKNGWIQSFPLIVRTGVARFGYRPLISGLFLFGLAVTPFFSKVQILSSIVNLVGIVGALYFLRIFIGIRGLESRVSRYLSLAGHREKLGLQATIGDDLRALILGWVPKGFFLNKDFSFNLFLVFASILFVAASLSPFASNSPHILIQISKFEIPDWLQETVVVTWLGFSIGAFLYSIFGNRRTKKILLVVDDLDRCEPEQMLAIIESLKLLLEDKEIHGRVQVIMLVEEKLLRKAIKAKFRGTSDLKIINEHLEKLFISYIRLPQLTEKELKKIFSKIFKKDQEKQIELLNAKKIEIEARHKEQFQMKKNQESPKPQDETEITRKELEETNNSLEEAHNLLNEIVGPAEPQITLDKADVVFTTEEIKVLMDKVPDLIQTTGINWGPRAMRSFLFKYQLCRLVLKKSGKKVPNTKELVNKLVEAIKAKDRGDEISDSQDPVKIAAQQVA